MNRIWLTGLIRRRWGSLVAAAAGVAVAVALVASLGSFLTQSRATMTQRATSGVAVDWQVQVRRGGDAAEVLRQARQDPGTLTALPVRFADTSGLRATSRGTEQTTGPGKVVGLPPGYLRAFPGAVRLLTGSLSGVLVSQQTAANLHVVAGDRIRIGRTGLGAATARVAGVVELPQADSLFQQVGAAARSQPVAPPDNVVLMPAREFAADFDPLARGRPDLVIDQVHVRRRHTLPPDPQSAFVAVTGAARHLEVATAGAATVGDNLGAVLDAAREDALYSQVLFLFLGAPGVVLAAALTAAVAEAGAGRRRREQQLLRVRGARRRDLLRLVVWEAAVIGCVAAAVGVLAASLIGRVLFGSASFGTGPADSARWGGLAALMGLLVAAAVVVLPARRDLRPGAVVRAANDRPRWLRLAPDLLCIALAGWLFWATGRNQYALVLAPEGVPTISVSYWAFLAPAFAWLGAALLSWRIADLVLVRGRRLVAGALRPAVGNLAPTVAAMMSRQRRVVARSAVLVGVALAFAVSTATFDSTYRHQAEVDAQLTNGGDVTVAASPGAGLPPGVPSSVASLPGVRGVATMQHRFAYVGSDLQDLYGIDPATLTRGTTLQDAYFQGGTASQMLARLRAQPAGVLVSAETVNDYQLNLGDQVRLRLQDARTHRYAVVAFRYVGIVNEFPTAPKDSFIVANAAYVAARTGSPQLGTVLIDTSTADVGAVARAVRRRVGNLAQVSTLDDARGLVGSSLTSVDLGGLTRLELGFALVIIAAAGGLVTGLGLTERRQAIAVATALGASPRQLRHLGLGEPAFVVVGGLLTGATAGSALSYLLVKVLSGVFDPPPAHLTVPWGYAAAAGLSAVAAVATAATAMARRARLRAGEHLHEL